MVLIPATNKIAVIVNVIDHSRVLVDGPEIERQVLTFKNCLLTNIKFDLPLNSGTKTVLAKWEKAEITAKWEKGGWFAKLKQKEIRANTSDFDRFKRSILRRKAKTITDKFAAKLRV